MYVHLLNDNQQFMNTEHTEQSEIKTAQNPTSVDPKTANT